MNRINKKRPALTLAEILVASVVIGILAAVMIPVLMNQDNKKAEYVTGLKKAYAELYAATEQIKAENGGTMLGVFGGSQNEFAKAYLEKLKYKKYCSESSDAGVCFHDGNSGWKTLDGQTGYRNFTQSARILGKIDVLYAFYDAYNNCDAGWIYSGGGCGFIAVDVNGFKAPNTMGRDIFEFSVIKTGIYPRDRTDSSTYCDPSSINSENGSGCAYRILKEGKMNY